MLLTAAQAAFVLALPLAHAQDYWDARGVGVGACPAPVVSFQPLGGPTGVAHLSDGPDGRCRISIDSGAAFTQDGLCRVLVHELGHWRLYLSGRDPGHTANGSIMDPDAGTERPPECEALRPISPPACETHIDGRMTWTRARKGRRAHLTTRFRVSRVCNTKG